jgi:triosephosphate isomerase
LKRKFVVGNWKMNGNPAEWSALIKGILEEADTINTSFIVCPPAAGLALMNSQIKTYASSAKLGAQDVHYKTSGAYTGDTSISMLEGLGVKYCIVGHSERRDYHKENSIDVSLKAKQCMKNNIVPIICIGESLADYEREQTIGMLSMQLDDSLDGLYPENSDDLMIAYEPIWAIGSGKTPSPKTIENVYRFLRSYLVDKYEDIGYDIPLLYGGSASPDNAEKYLAEKNINGFLVGGASLKAEMFLELGRKSAIKEGY